MKVTRIITQELDLEIIEATLLTIEEVKQLLPNRLRTYNNWWWLRSPGYYYNCVANVLEDGYVNLIGNYVGIENLTVRPALIISNLESSDFRIGDTFEFGNREFEVISTDRAFCLTDIGQYAFSKDWESDDANVYEKSDVKKYVDRWFEKVKETEQKYR